MSLLQNSDLHFRLIGNALDDREAALLQAISESSTRLQFINLESKNIIPHGTLVDVMLQTEQSALFSFCDSDLFLFAPLTEQSLLAEMAGFDVLSSGGRIENENTSTYAGFKGGATTVSPDGQIALATSFFCVYRRALLQQSLSAYQVGFEQYRSSQQIPPPALAVVEQLALDYEMFDTGKLLSVVLHQQGGVQKYLDIPGLTHIGGMSGRYLLQLNMSEPVVIEDAELGPAVTTHEQTFNVRNDYEKALKKCCGKYYFCYLNHLLGKNPAPRWEPANPVVRDTIARLSGGIDAIIERIDEYPECRQIWSLIQAGTTA